MRHPDTAVQYTIMDTSTYQSNMTILVSESVIQNNDYFNYEFSPIKEIYELFYTYCQEYLDLKSVELKVSPAKLYYSNDTSINASADKRNGYFLVSINCGTILHMHSFFLEKKEVFEKDEFKQYSKVLFKLGYQVQDFLTIVLYKFIFHHEVGHLVQKSEVENFSFPETFTSDNIHSFDSFTHHILEFDADWLASCNISFLTLDLIKEADDNNFTQINLENIITLTITGIISYFIKSNSRRELYFEKEKHPHNFIRLIYITELILPLIIHNTNIQVNSNDILHNVLTLTTLLFENEDYNPIMDFTAIYSEHKNQIREYIEKIKQAVNNNSTLSVKKLKSKDMFGKTFIK